MENSFFEGWTGNNFSEWDVQYSQNKPLLGEETATEDNPSVKQKQHVGQNTKPVQVTELISERAVSVEDGQLAMEHPIVNKDIVRAVEQRYRHMEAPTTVDSLLSQQNVWSQESTPGTDLRFMREPPVWKEEQTGKKNIHSAIGAPPSWEAFNTWLNT